MQTIEKIIIVNETNIPPFSKILSLISFVAIANACNGNSLG